jgi:tetratricopeptide (TPR) repeat protein
MKLPRAVAILVLLWGGCAVVRAQAPVQPAPQPPFDPYHAGKSIEVGQYYMKKGNYDAAIERFREAARYQPNLARAYRLLGEAHEKKGNKAEAVKAYRRYLEILPTAEDAGKVRKLIVKLSRDLDRAARRPSG